MTTLNESNRLHFLHPDGNGVRILALDGGDTRCFSQLLVLGELMRRLEYDHGRSIRPCEFFHSITGVGASGVIAILLGVLGMTAEEAAKAFSSICGKIYAEDVCNETCRSEILATEIEGILSKLEIPLGTRLEGDIDRSAGCLVSICYSSAPIHGCRMFRNYPSHHFSHNPTIVEAARASWATPGLFSSLLVGYHPTQEELVSAVNGFNNPTLEAVRAVRELFGVDRAVSSFLSLGSGRRLPVSIHSDGFVQGRVLDTDDTEETCERDFGPSGVYYRFSPDYTIQSKIVGVDSNQLSAITSYTSVYLERVKTSRALESYLRASAYTSDSDLQFRAQARNVATQSNPVPLTSRLSPEEKSILKKLRIPAEGDTSPVERCMEGTREDVLKSINDWTTDFNAPNILWLKGHPGVGKSAIAMEVLDQLGTLRRLGSSFFFQRQNNAVLTPRALWRTTAYDLARRHPTARKIIVARLEEEEVSPATASIEMLFRHFIQEPLTASTDIPTARSPVIVIDALDECGGFEGQNSTHRRHLIQTLRRWSYLPGKFKLIVTSRAENDIERLFREISHHPLEISAGQTVDAQSLSDIRIFFTERFRQIAVQYPRSLSPNWPEPQIVNKLTDRAAGLFIWAETVIKFVTLGEPQRRLSQVLDGGQAGDVDELYNQILSTVFQRPSERDNINFRSIVGAIIFAKAPLSFSSLAQLLSTNESTVEHICNGLQSILNSTGILQFYHQSFVDFMLNKDKCPQEYLIDPQDQHHSLTLACLTTMRDNLRFNICSIESSYIRNDDIPDLATRAAEHIPPHVFYSSCWWATHLSEIEFELKIFGHLQYFMREQFLSWLEVLSLAKRVNLASQMLLSLIRWIPLHHEGDAMAVAIDMQKFVATFSNPISQSVPHIYLSCLPFSPRTSTIWNQYTPIYRQTLAIQAGGLSAWPAVQNVLVGHDSGVNSVAFSPDGRHIVSGSYDKTIRIWDAETGQTITGPLKGHTSSVTSVTFSPDGRRVVSGSRDRTIRVWNAETGQTVTGPLKGHSSRVNSVAFSPDGRRVVSGSSDQTIRIWDAEAGQEVIAPLEGSSGVSSVAFSRDGRRVVSGSHDQTIRIWDAATGQMVIDPLEGHSGLVYSVAFSPDGKHIVSGSEDQTIRIWDAEMGHTVTILLQGHTSLVNSVDFSPDGRRIVSGADDHTIRIWDAATGQRVTDPLEGHSDGVNSVAFSPDGRHIVSGSYDSTIQIWDIEMGQMVTGPLKESTTHIYSAAFSPDGACVVSGSSEKTIRIWDAVTGQMVTDPLEGHTNGVKSVAFSPDGKHIVSGSGDQTIRIWDAVTGQTVTAPLEGHSGGVNSVAFSPDGRRVVSGSHDQTIRIWDAATGQMVIDPLEGHSGSVYSVAFSPDGKNIVSGSEDQTIRIWDAVTGQTVTGPLKGHKNWVTSAAFSPDGRRVVSGSYDRTIQIWDAETGHAVTAPLQGHMDLVTSVSFSPDGICVISGSQDQTIRVWDAEPGQMITHSVEGHAGHVTPSTSLPDGTCGGSTSEDFILRGLDPGIHYSKHPDQSCSLFNSTSLMKDGWALGPNSELLFWVPPALRVGLWRPGNKLIIGKLVQTRLKFNSFAHGDSWTHCKSQGDPRNEVLSDGGRFTALASSSGSSSGRAILSDGFRSIPVHRSAHAKRKASQNLGDLSGVVGVTRKKARLGGN